MVDIKSLKVHFWLTSSLALTILWRVSVGAEGVEAVVGLGISLELRLLAKMLSFFILNITVAAK